MASSDGESVGHVYGGILQLESDPSDDNDSDDATTLLTSHPQDAVAENQLCDKCLGLISRVERLLNNEHDSHDHCLHQDAESHARSIRSGCPLCIQTLHILQCRGRKLPGNTSSDTSPWAIHVRCSSGSVTSDDSIRRLFYELEFALGNLSGDAQGTLDKARITLSRVHSREIPEKCFQAGPPISSRNSTHTSSAQVADLLAWWHGECLSSHNCSHGVKEPHFHPPRLIQITDGARCRLIETAKTEPTGPYTALSYRWGPDPHHLILTAQNLPWLSKGIRCTQLPQTFQDAISITRKLGMSYLWVDSLCILQDGEGAADDWLRHVQVMGSIYEGCSLNIAAADAVDAHGGCYFSRDALTLACPLVDMRVGDRKRTLELASPEIQGRLALFPLNSRAWVFQERLLAPRTVHFARHQVFWECGKVPAASERFPRGMPRYYHEWNWGTERQLPASSIYHPPPAAPRYLHDVWTLHHGWEMAVEAFNATAMTRREDKLPAIAGVAARISRLTNDDYVAGFFKSQLPHGLLWSGRRWGGEFHPFRRQYRAPSWSWASTDGPVDFLGPCSSFMECHRDVECAQVLETRVDLVNKSDPFGQIRFASIKLSGPSFVREIVREKGIKEPSLQRMAPLQDLRENWDFPRTSLRHLISSKVHLFVVRTTPEEDVANGYYVEGLILCPTQSIGDPSPSQLFERLGKFEVNTLDYECVRTELANATKEIIII